MGRIKEFGETVSLEMGLDGELTEAVKVEGQARRQEREQGEVNQSDQEAREGA